jgi:hypothetical protein
MTRREVARLEQAIHYLMLDTDDPAGGFHDGMAILSDVVRAAKRRLAKHAKRG